MNPKIEKLRAENRKDKERLAKLQADIKARDKKVAELESTDIQNVMREYSVTPDELVDLIRASKGVPVPDKEVK